jgi:hypothetical protein
MKLMSRMILTGLITVLASLFFLVSVPNADVIYNNITLHTTITAVQGSGPLYDSFFTGATAYNLTIVGVVLEGSSAAGNTSVGLYSDASTAPGTLLYAIGNIPDTALTTTFTEYDLPLASPYSLAANTRYWIGLVGFLSTTANWAWTPVATGQTGVTGEYYAYASGVSLNTGTLGEQSGPYQMKITATSASVAVPEPSLMVLLCISIMSVAGLRRWWKD